jgi:hypothetical protein
MRVSGTQASNAVPHDKREIDPMPLQLPAPQIRQRNRSPASRRFQAFRDGRAARGEREFRNDDQPVANSTPTLNPVRQMMRQRRRAPPFRVRSSIKRSGNSSSLSSTRRAPVCETSEIVQVRGGAESSVTIFAE